MNPNTPELNNNDIKNNIEKDRDYFRIYMRERYRTNTSKKVDCDVSGKSVIYATMARHKKGIKCRDSSQAYKSSVNERLKRIEEFMSKFNMNGGDEHLFIDNLD